MVRNPRPGIPRLVKIVTLISMVLVIGIVGIGVAMRITGATGSTYNTELRTIKVTVMPGDTLWALARKYSCPEYDLRFIVDDIMKTNNLSNTTIMPGQIIELTTPLVLTEN